MNQSTNYYGQIEGTWFETIKPEFDQYYFGHARVDRLWSGARWSEGPAWFAAGRYLVWSDIPNNRMLRWDETNEQVSVFRQPAGNSNGNTVDNHGRLISCEHLNRCVSRTEHNGSRVVLADQFDGKRFNSPNDVVVKSDDSIWFTDPDYGISAEYEGDASEPEQDGCHIYRIDSSGEVTRVASDFDKPNGIAFSVDERILYVSDTGITHTRNGPHHIRRLLLSESGESVVSDGELAECTNGLFDGFRVDVKGNIWTSAGDGVHCLNSAGELIGKIHIPEIVGNVTFGGAKNNRLFICGTTSLYAVYLNTKGCKLG